jgi:hypothetical protein
MIDKAWNVFLERLKSIPEMEAVALAERPKAILVRCSRCGWQLRWYNAGSWRILLGRSRQHFKFHSQG